MAFENSNDWKEFLHLESEETPAAPFVVKRIVKRDGSIEKYDRWKIASAISRAVSAVQGMEDKELTERLTEKTEDNGYYGYGMMIVTGKEVEGYKGNKFQIVYRTIDLKNPFLTITGVKRTLSEDSNWYNKTDLIDENVYKNDPFLIVTLTPTTIKSIREDNKSIDYSEISIKSYDIFKNKYNDIFTFNN